MKFKARAKTPKRCAYAPCGLQASKIYIDEKWKVLACSQAHADLARKELDKIPDEEIKTFWPEAVAK